MTTDFWLSHVFSVIYVLIVTRIFLEISARDTLPQNERHSLLCVATIEFLPRSFFHPAHNIWRTKTTCFIQSWTKSAFMLKSNIWKIYRCLAFCCWPEQHRLATTLEANRLANVDMQWLLNFQVCSRSIPTSDLSRSGNSPTGSSRDVRRRRRVSNSRLWDALQRERQPSDIKHDCVTMRTRPSMASSSTCWLSHVVIKCVTQSCHSQ